MFDHIGLRVSDLQRSARFYANALKPLGFVICSEDEQTIGIGPENAPVLWLHRSRERSSVHVAFKASTRKSVDEFARAGLQHGGKENGAPGVRTDYAPNYYAAFLLDPDGNNVEAVCLE